MQLRFKIMLAIAAVVIAVPVSHAANRLLLCGGVQVREGRIDTIGGGSRFIPTWNWRPEASDGLPTSFILKFSTVDDCKPTPDGKELLVSSSSGAVAIVAFPGGETRFYAAVPNAHSIALLPHGMVVAAASTNATGNRLMLFDRNQSDHVIASLPLEGAHGVVWDTRRNVLWALGDKELLRLTLNSNTPGLTVAKRYPIEGGGGHDLVLVQDGRSLFVTTSGRVLAFDIQRETFSPYQPLEGLHDVKSISVNPTTGQIAYTRADKRIWWTYTVRFLFPAMEVPLECHTYKVRWSAR